ncbi:MAG TPA: hypothetical protein VHP34_09645 [Alphaproteobacteria bacterium]|nr:hypothetical protein [Alphaproteobacteria bacterium]
MTAPKKLSELKFRTEALLAENPEDDFRLHHVYWFSRPSFNKEKAAKGLVDITRVEVSSCKIYCGQGSDMELEEALAKMEELEKALRAKGGQPIDPKDTFYVERMGSDYSSAHHVSRYEELRLAEIAQISADSTKLDSGITPMKQIRFKKSGGQNTAD